MAKPSKPIGFKMGVFGTCSFGGQRGSYILESSISKAFSE